MIKSAMEYHNITSYRRNEIGGHQLDWHNQPALYKKYKNLENIPLPVMRMSSTAPLKSIISTENSIPNSKLSDINSISAILHLTYSITARAKHSSGFYYYRSAASAGALYPVELYVMVRNIDDLEDGVYHFNILNHSLTRLRKGDFSVYTGSAVFPSSGNRPAVSFILSSLFFRSSWKYRDRAYRYHLLDTGHVMNNLILALNFSGMHFNIFYDFDDAKVNRLIGTDEFREVALSIINIPGTENTKYDITSIDELPGEITSTGIVPGNDIDYSTIREMHEAGRIPPIREIIEKDISPADAVLPEKIIDIKTADYPKNSISYPECLFLRRSKRNFVDSKIDKNSFMAILDMISNSEELNNGKIDSHELLNITFFPEKIDNIDPGLYFLDSAEKKFGIIREGIYNHKIAHTCLNQEWLKNAGLHFLFSCNIDESDKKYGPRGYRYAMMNAGNLGQLLYVTATALNLGCCGIGAFYDEETVDLLDLERKYRPLYLVSIGKIKA